MNNRLATWLIVGMLPLVASCAASRDSVVIGPVGPQPLIADDLTPKGYLKVYTATEDHDDGDVHYFPHTSYTVYSEDGKTVVKKVGNAISIHDEDPFPCPIAGRQIRRPRGSGELRHGGDRGHHYTGTTHQG